MKDTLDKLKADFNKWRKNKRYVREPVPDVLLERARRAVKKHGIPRVAKATKLDRSRLTGGRAIESMNDRIQSTPVPSYSQLDLATPQMKNLPVAEVETPKGLKLRIFTPTQEMLDLLSSMCSPGGAQ